MPDGRDDQAPEADAPEQSPTGLGSGTASGLGHSLTSEPEPLLGDDHTADEDTVEDETP